MAKQSKWKVTSRRLLAELASFLAVVIYILFTATYYIHWTHQISNSHGHYDGHHGHNNEEIRNNGGVWIDPKTKKYGRDQQQRQRQNQHHEIHTTTNNNKEKKSVDNFHQIPVWIQNYIDWHHDMLQQYPGEQLFTNPDAPNILLRYCGICGGLHDRLGQLPWDFYLANQTQRLLFIMWHRPKPLETFLTPSPHPGLNWSLPYTPDSLKTNKDVRKHKRLFEGCLRDESNPNENPEFWGNEWNDDKNGFPPPPSSLDGCLERARRGGEFANHKILRHRLLGHLHEHHLERRLRQLGETDMIHATPTFGRLFHLLFTPSPRVQHLIDQIHQRRPLHPPPNGYTAVHCRVRHPKATPSNQNIKGQDTKPADLSGLPWHGETRSFAITTATKALRCTQQLLSKQQQQQQHGEELGQSQSQYPLGPIYFFSDSNDLVRYMVEEVQQQQQRHLEQSHVTTTPVEHAAIQSVQSLLSSTPSSDTSALVQPLFARDMSHANAHIDRQIGLPVEEYLGTFVDLWLALEAKCVVYGVGFFAMFAAKLSGTQCRMTYQDEAWGGEATKERFNQGGEICGPERNNQTD